MAKLINKTQGFTVVNGTITQDHRLGIKERGLLVTLLSLPDEWEYSVLGLTKILPDGRDAIISSVRKLESAGYLKRVQSKNDKGKFDGYDWEVTDEPFTENPYTENPSTEKPSTENQPQLNKKESNTQELIINNQSIKSNNNYNNILDNSDEPKDRLIDSELIEEIKEQIDYDVLSTAPEYKITSGDLDAIVEAIAVLKTATNPMKFGDSTYEPDFIRNRANSIDAGHVEYVFDCFYANKKEIYNIKNYLVASVFNAPTTIDAYYTNLVNQHN